MPRTLGAVVVETHHTAIADDISQQYRRQAAGRWRGMNGSTSRLVLIGSVELSGIAGFRVEGK